MAVYNMDKIKEWYDDFNSCKSSYLNNHYQAYKSSYVVNNGDPATNKMQEKLDTYYSRLKKAYSKVGTQWKNLYSDLMNADAALAGQKSSGSLNSSSASAKISAMPKLIEYKNVLQMSALTKAAVASMVTGANISTQGMSDLAVESNGSSNSSNISEMTATGAILGATIASIVPGLGTAVGAVLGAATGALVGSGIVSKVKDWLVGTGQTIKETAINVKNKVGSIVNSVKNTEDTLDKIKVIGSGAKQIGKKFAATGATIATSAVEGIYKLLEDAVDLVALAGAAVASVGTGTVDLVNAAKAKVSGDSSFKSNYTKQMWEKTRSFVSTDFVGNVFDSFYEDTPAGQWIKNNSIGFDTTRAITKEVSEVIGVVALSTVTGGGAAVMYGAAKVAEHTESNWQDENTSTAKGLLKGTLQGVADGAFFSIGAKGDAALKTAAEATSKTALKSAGIEVAENASKKALQESLKGLSKESVKVLGKDLSKMLAKKTAFECATSVAQDLGTIGIDTILSNDTVTDTNGNIIKLNSLSEKWNYYYKQAGGVQGLAQSMLTAGILSGLSDTVDTTQLLKGAKQVQKQANKVAFKSAASAVKDDILDSVTKVKDKLDSSTLKQKVSDSVSNTKSKLQSANLKTSYKLDQLKASANIKLVNGGIALLGKTTDLGTTIKNFTEESLSKVKNKLDNSTVKQKVSDSISNTKSKISDIGSNIKEYASDKVKNVNLKLKNSLSNTKFKLSSGVATLSGTAISLKNKLKASIDDIVNKINVKKQAKEEVKLEINNINKNIKNVSDNNLDESLNFKKLNNVTNSSNPFDFNTGKNTPIEKIKKAASVSSDDSLNVQKLENVTNSFDNSNNIKYKKFNSYTEFVELNKTNRENWIKSLDSSEQKIIKNYISESDFSSYKTLNGFFRDTLLDFKNQEVCLIGFGGNEKRVSFKDWEFNYMETIPELIARTEKEANILESAISKSKLKENAIFYRAAGNSARLFEKLGITNNDLTLEGLKKLEGKVYTEKGFMSASPDSNLVFNKNINFIMYCEAGTPIGDFADWNSAEKEVLLNKGQKFDINKVEERNGKFFIHMTTIS